MLAAITDPEWAVALNTALLIVFTVINGVHNRRVSRKASAAHVEATDAKRATGANRRATDKAGEQSTEPVISDPAGPQRRYTDTSEFDSIR
jgi:hypothetical protein